MRRRNADKTASHNEDEAVNVYSSVRYDACGFALLHGERNAERQNGIRLALQTRPHRWLVRRHLRPLVTTPSSNRWTCVRFGVDILRPTYAKEFRKVRVTAYPIVAQPQ